MLSRYPAPWLLLTLPYLSSLVLRSVPCLRRLASAKNWLTRPLGMLGLACLFAGLLSVIPSPFGLPVAIAGGMFSGYTVFTVRKGNGGEGEDWRRPGPPRDEPPPPPPEGAPIDWDLFDRTRAQWAREPVMRH